MKTLIALFALAACGTSNASDPDAGAPDTDRVLGHWRATLDRSECGQDPKVFEAWLIRPQPGAVESIQIVGETLERAGLVVDTEGANFFASLASGGAWMGTLRVSEGTIDLRWDGDGCVVEASGLEIEEL